MVFGLELDDRFIRNKDLLRLTGRAAWIDVLSPVATAGYRDEEHKRDRAAHKTSIAEPRAERSPLPSAKSLHAVRPEGARTGTPLHGTPGTAVEVPEPRRYAAIREQV